MSILKYNYWAYYWEPRKTPHIDKLGVNGS